MKMKIPERVQWWFAFLGGALAWVFHLMASYAIGEFACVLKMHQTALWLLTAVTVISLAVTSASLWIAWRWKDRFMGQAGLAADGIFLLAILAQGFSILTAVEGC